MPRQKCPCTVPLVRLEDLTRIIIEPRLSLAKTPKAATYPASRDASTLSSPGRHREGLSATCYIPAGYHVLGTMQHQRGRFLELASGGNSTSGAVPGNTNTVTKTSALRTSFSQRKETLGSCQDVDFEMTGTRRAIDGMVNLSTVLTRTNR